MSHRPHRLEQASCATPVTSEQVSDAVLRGSWVVDLRARSDYARAHLPGSVNVEHDEGFAAHVGWMLPCEDDIVLLSDSPADLLAAAHDLAGLGIHRLEEHLLEARDRLSASYRVARWDDWVSDGPSDQPRRVVVDVRTAEEHGAGHVPGAVHVDLAEVERRAPLLPSGELWVHCATGRRAAVAASVLHRMGRRVVHVDDTWDRAAARVLAPGGGLAA